jgi:hypothetical protein
MSTAEHYSIGDHGDFRVRLITEGESPPSDGTDLDLAKLTEMLSVQINSLKSVAEGKPAELRTIKMDGYGNFASVALDDYPEDYTILAHVEYSWRFKADGRVEVKQGTIYLMHVLFPAAGESDPSASSGGPTRTGTSF